MKEGKIQLIDKDEDSIKGGLADKMSIMDIAKKHNVSLEQIKDQLIKGAKVEMEHTEDKKKSIEIAMDHLSEDAYYYDKLESIHVDETESLEEKKYSDEAQDFISAKIKKLKDEGKPQDQAVAIAINMAREKGLKVPAEQNESKHINESFSDKMKRLSGIKEGGDSKYLTNESVQDYTQSRLLKESHEMDPANTIDPENPSGCWPLEMQKEMAPEAFEKLEESEEDEGFIIHEFEQPDVEPGEDDKELYNMEINESENEDIDLSFLSEDNKYDAPEAFALGGDFDGEILNKPKNQPEYNSEKKHKSDKDKNK